MCQPTSKGCVHLIWDSWRSWPKYRKAGFAAQKDLCSCKHSISHTILCISSPLHIYISWLDHKCFFCKDVVVWSEFSSLVENNAENADLDVQFSPCLIDDNNTPASVQKTAKSRGRFTLMEDKRPLSFSILFYLPVLLLWPCHSTTVTPLVWWASSPVHGKWRDCTAKIGTCEKEKSKSPLAKVSPALS